MFSTKCLFISIEERYGLDSGNFEALAAAEVLAGQQVFAADHVRAGLGELGAIAFVGTSGELLLLGADDPADVVFVLLAAMGAGERGFPGLLPLVIKFALFHRQPPGAIIPQGALPGGTDRLW